MLLKGIVFSLQLFKKQNTSNTQQQTLSNSEMTNNGNTKKGLNQPTNITLILSGAGALVVITAVVLIAQWRKYHSNHLFPHKGDYGIVSEHSVDEWSYDQSAAGLVGNLKYHNMIT